MKPRGLGRGLNALLGNEVSQQEQLKTLSVDLLQAGKYQPRTSMHRESLAELSESIKSQGVMQPILVREASSGRYEIIAGERRWRAAKMAGLLEIPVVVKTVSDESALAMALIENIQREDLDPIEEANGIQRLITEFGMTHQNAAEAVGRSRSGVTNLLRLLNLARPVKELLQQGLIEMGHARALLGLSQAKQIFVANRVAQERLSVRQTELLVQQPDTQPRVKGGKKIDSDIARLEEEISNKLAAKVKIIPTSSGKGKLVVEYSSLQQLDELIRKF